MNQTLITIGAVALATVVLALIAGCSTNGKPMRLNPKKGEVTIPPSRSSEIVGRTKSNQAVSCSFIEFDERGDFLDFDQHTNTQTTIKRLVAEGPVVVVVYCHGWKNNSQSGDVVEFNAFLAKLADSKPLKDVRVHGIYLGWRGNPFRPHVNKGPGTDFEMTTKLFGGPIVDSEYHRGAYWTGALPETLSYWNRRRAAEHKVSGLAMARAIFTYAATTKDYGRKLDNSFFVIGHSFGALMLEQSLGQAMTGALTLEWWDGLKGQADDRPGLPFDMVLFVNSAAPAIYGKQMRDFLKAHRSALGHGEHPAREVPVIVSVTSTADAATGVVHPIGNVLAPLQPSLKRKYTSGIFGEKVNGAYPSHDPIRQSKFYTKTPGHHPYLINHWIAKESDSLLPADVSPEAIFSANLSLTAREPDLFFTSATDKKPATAWRLTMQRQGPPVTLNGMSPSMQDSDYWIVSCGKDLISGHNDVWSTTTMEMYAALFRAAEARRKTQSPTR